MKPYLFVLPECQGKLIPYELGKTKVLTPKEPFIASYVLPENATLSFFRQRRNGKYYTHHNWSYGEIIVPDTSLELFEWSTSSTATSNSVRIPLDLAQAFRVDVHGDYFVAASNGCLPETSVNVTRQGVIGGDLGQPANKFFSWSNDDCHELVRLAQQSQNLLPEFMPKLKTVKNYDRPHQGEDSSETVDSNGQQQRSAPEKYEKTHRRLEETQTAMSTSSDADNWFWSWGWWIVFGLILLGGLVLIWWLWRVQKRRRETTPTIREVRYTPTTIGRNS